MNEIPADPVGAAWLAQHFHIATMARLPVVSKIGGRRTSEIVDGFRVETYIDAMRPDSDPASHLQFHLRHEVPHLELLSRVFQRSGPAFVQDWINTEPTGQYARRAAFLYEWLTHDQLSVPERLSGNYVDAIDDNKLVAASPDQIEKVQRWRVNDNMPGTRFFCPIIVKNAAVEAASALDVQALITDLADEFGEELLMRAAVWMTLRESKSSFAIEGEADKTNRIQRFADVMGRRTGQGPMPLDDASLADLQREILGNRTTLTSYGVRSSPVFIGQSSRGQEIVHYVAPPAGDAPAMLTGLGVFMRRTAGQSPAMRSAVASFGFVYIHPMADGNGRVHRFLVNDSLRRDGVIQDPMILPISAVITDDAGEHRNYHRVLDEVSKPLMNAVLDRVKFTATQTKYPDGVVSNLDFSGDEQARPLWRYPDLGPHVVFLSNIIRRTITEQMREESRLLRSHTFARKAIKEVVEMPDHQADRVLRSIQQNAGKLSGVLLKEIPVLGEDGVWDGLLDALREATQNLEQADHEVTKIRNYLL
jgi:hypothetical protein